MVDWKTIEVILLDMDGTLLDLHFDTHFWLHHVPLRYAEARGIALDSAKAEILPRIREIQGTLEWYSVDHWSAVLDLDIGALKREVAHLIAVHPHVLDFLRAARRLGKRLVLVTNAHSKSLALKLERTCLAGHLDAVVCAHDLGAPKEQAEFWRRLARREPFAPARALLVDDNLVALRAAREYGVGALLAVRRPDSRAPHRDTAEFPSIENFREIMPPAPVVQLART